MPRPAALEAQMTARGFISTELAAERTGYLVGSMTRLCSEGKVKAERTGRFWWIEQESLIAYLGGTPTVRELVTGQRTAYLGESITPKDGETVRLVMAPRPAEQKQ